MYGDTEQTRFVPVVMEHAEDGSMPLPIYLKSRFCIDLAGNDTIEDLVRHLYGKPRFERPQLGPAPDFGDGEAQSRAALEAAQRSLSVGARDSVARLQNALKATIEEIDSLRIPDDECRPQQVEAAILRLIDGTVPLRTRVVSLVRSVAQNQPTQQAFDLFEDFFERALHICRPHRNPTAFEPARFVVLELFMLYLAVLAKHRVLPGIETLLKATFVVNGKAKSFSGFSLSLSIVSQCTRDAPTGHRWHDYTANLLRDRCDDETSFEQLQEVDMLLFVRSRFEGQPRCWRPRTLVLRGEYAAPFDVFIGARGERRMAVLRAFLGTPDLGALADRAEAEFAGQQRMLESQNEPLDIIRAMALPSLLPDRFGGEF